MYVLFSLIFYILYCAKCGCKIEKKKKKGKKYSESECVDCIFFMNVFFNDKIAKNKEEFHILIYSRSRIMNLYLSRISNI
jgi:hypothetical protein